MLDRFTLASNPAVRIRIAALLLEKIADRILREHAHTTFSHFLLLATLRAHPEISQEKIAKYHGWTEAAISRQAETLTRQGLLRREKNARNRRMYLLSITPAGNELLEQSYRLLTQKIAPVTDTLSKKDQQTLNRILDKLLEAACAHYPDMHSHAPPPKTS